MASIRRFARSSTLSLRIAAIATVVALAACGGGGDSDRDAAERTLATVRAASLRPGDPAPDATDDAMLRIAGASQSNAGDTLELDLAALEQLGLVRATIYEPFEKVDIEFTGVELRRVVDFAGIASADLRMVALDDYTIDLTAEEAVDEGAIVALYANGSPIPVEEGGPIRLVFVDGSELADHERLWIWSLAELAVVER